MSPGPTLVTATPVAFPGEPGSFAEDAVLAYFGERGTPTALATFADVVAAVADGTVKSGVVPIENVVFGTVREVYDLLAEARVAITGEVIVPVRLCLAALPGERLDSIERVYSHIQALGQAEAFLRTRPWSLLASTNTAGAGKMIVDRRERGSAAVLSLRAAELFGLEVLATDIQTEPSNRTRFLVLGPEGSPPSPVTGDRPMRSTVVLSVHNEPGSLHRVLGVLAAHDLNMSKLEITSQSQLDLGLRVLGRPRRGPVPAGGSTCARGAPCRVCVAPPDRLLSQGCRTALISPLSGHGCVRQMSHPETRPSTNSPALVAD